MDNSLFRGAVKLHGAELERLVKEEQGINFGGAASDLATAAEHDVHGTSAPSPSNKQWESPCNKSTNVHDVAETSKELKSIRKQDDRRESSDKNVAGEQFSNKLYGFIARKADLVFRQQNDNNDNEKIIADAGFSKDAEKTDFYAILPPIEQFLGVSPDISQTRLFDILRVGDVVIGQILSTKEFGLFVKLLALCQGPTRFLEECEVVAFLPAGELRDKFAHVASVDDFQIGDLIRALVIRVNVEEEKVIISLHSKDETQDIGSLGLITEFDLPVHYQRSVLQLDTQESYQEMLHNTVGFDNPFNVVYLGTQLRLNEACPMSLMRGLQRSNFPEKEFSEPLRKWQTNRWAMESVAKGVEYFKAGKLLDAMQHLNKALEIDEENVEALVARGALYANKDLLSKAMQDFGKALKINPNHRNANKYLCETLVERGKQHEEAGEIEKAADCYQTALDIKPDFLEAQLCLQKVKKTRSPEKKNASPENILSPCSTQDVMSVKALRQLVEPENDVPGTAKKKVKKKKKKKEKEKESTRKISIEGRPFGKREKKSDKKKRYSSLDSSDSPRSRSRSRHRSGKETKLKSRRSKKHSRRSYSSFSSSSKSSVCKGSGRSPYRQRKRSKQDKSSDDDLRSRSRSKSLRSDKRKSLEDSVSLRKSTYSGGKKRLSNHSRRQTVSGSRSRSPKSSCSSVSSRRSRKRSRSKERDQSKRTDKTRNRSKDETFREDTKTSRYQSPSVSPSSRRRTLSRESHESGSKKRLWGKSSEKLGYKELSHESKRSLKRESKGESFAEKTTRTKPKELEISPARSLPMEKTKIAQKSSDTLRDFGKSEKAGEKIEKAKLIDTSGVHKQKMSQLSTDSKEKKTSREYDQESKKHSDAYSSSDENRRKKSKVQHTKRSSLTANAKDDFKTAAHSKDQKVTKSEDPKGRGKGNKVRKIPSRESSVDRRSRSRSYSSDRSYSDKSYSSYSVSGSRSYSYSSYSSGTYSSSDDSHDRRKNSPKRQSRNKSPDKKKRKGEFDTDESDSDFDTGIYEISRDHLEMYMDSKSYQLQKAADKSPLKAQKKPRKDEASKAESKSRKRRKDTSDEESDKSKTPVLFPAAYKESQKTSKHAKSSDKKRTERVASPSSVSASSKIQTSSQTVPDPVLHPSKQLDAFRTDRDGKTFSPTQGHSEVHAKKPSHHAEKHQVVHVVPGVATHELMTPSQEGFRLEPNRTQLGSLRAEDTSRSHHLLADQLLPNDESQDFRSSHTVPPPSHRNTVPTSTQSQDHPGDVFTQEQISFIESISKQLAGTRHKTPEREPLDAKPMQHDLMQLEVYKRSSIEEQGHPIGVVMTHRQDDRSDSTKEYREMDSQDDRGAETHGSSFSDGRKSRKRRWDVREQKDDRDESRGSEEKNRKSVSLEDVKPAPTSFDYNHGSTSRHDSESHSHPETSRSDRPSDPGYGQSSSSSYKRHDFENTKEKEYLDKHESEERYRSRQGMRVERSGGERSRDGIYNTRHEQEEIERGVSSSSSGTKIAVVDYQHGKSDRYHERGQDGRESRRHRSPENKHESRSDRRSGYNHGSGNRRRSDERDKHRDHGRHSHRDRHHETSGNRTHSRTQGSEMRIEPKESNPFLQLVSSSKDMQIAALHSEGKWGYNFSPKDDHKSSSRLWWA